METSASSQHQQDFYFQPMLQKDLAREQIKETQGHFPSSGLNVLPCLFISCLTLNSLPVASQLCSFQTMATGTSECAFVWNLLHLSLLPSFWINRLCPPLLVGSRTLTQSPRGRLLKKQGFGRADQRRSCRCLRPLQGP